jgi:hypothetical protein
LATLELLERTGWITFTHRPAASATQVIDEVHQWSKRQRGGSMTPLLYLAGHGDRDILETWTDELRLSQLAESCSKKLAGRLVHFGSCLSAVDHRGASAALTQFKTVTTSVGVSGYAASPEWIEAAAFELLLFAVLAEGWERWGSAYAYVRRHYGALAERLGFATDRDGASMS